MGAVQMGDALLRVCGGRAVQLRIAQPPVAGDAREELGLVAPEYQDAEIGPAVFRKLSEKDVLLVSSTAVQRLAGRIGAGDAVTVLKDAAGVVVDGAVFAIADVAAETHGSEVACYALTLREVA